MNAKPEQSEAAPYYFKYIDRVDGGDIRGILAGQLEETLAWSAAVSEARSLHRYAADKWSIREVLSHITDCERVFAFRALWFARGLDAELPGLDQDVAARAAEADRVSWPAHVEEFRRVRLATISLFENLPAEAWMRGGVASGHHVTVRALAYIIAGHWTHHTALLKERYL
jgi:hypothetical protein